jgi:hypothetical protein
VCTRASVVSSHDGNVLPVGSIVSEPRKLSVEDNRSTVGHRVASHPCDDATVDTPANALIPLLLVAKLKFDRSARPQPEGALDQCSSS